MSCDPGQRCLQLKEEELLGSFDGVASKFVTVDATGVVTLGRYSFMQFKPDDLKVCSGLSAPS